jgi:tetratricopeptide (TPR) repeat protein
MVPADRGALERFVAGLLAGPLDRPGVLRQAGVGLLVLGRHKEAVRLLRRALDLAADGRQAIPVHINLGDAHRYGGDTEAAEPHYREALRLAETGHPDLVHFCLQHLAKQRLDQGRTAEARALLEEVLRLRRALGDASLLVSTRETLRLVAQAERGAS